jgi:hypothetical protein
VIYAYAITEPTGALSAMRGLCEAALRTMRADGVQGVYSEHTELDLTPTTELLWAHEEVVDALMCNGPVLPLRFGTGLATAAELRQILQRSGAEFRRRLERVRGCVELAVRLGVPFEESMEQAVDGSDYMRTRLAAIHAGREAAERVLRPLAELATATAQSEPCAEPVVKASYLIAAADLEDFASAVKRLQECNPDLSLSCTGPWAPYSFVQGALE